MKPSERLDQARAVCSQLPSQPPRPVCRTCVFFDPQARGPGTQALYLAMAASSLRYYPTVADMSTIRIADKDGGCMFAPDSPRKWNSDWCGQHKERT